MVHSNIFKFSISIPNLAQLNHEGIWFSDVQIRRSSFS